MREEIRARLLAFVPEVVAPVADPNGVLIGDRVYEPHVVTDATPKPFLTYRVLQEPTEGERQARGFTVEVAGYTDLTTYEELDTILAKAQVALDQWELIDAVTGERYYFEFTGSPGPEHPDDVWQALTRSITFDVTRADWREATTYEPDPVTALRGAIEADPVMSPLETDPDTWQPTTAAPGMYWRVDQWMGGEATNWGAWYDVRLVGHILAPTAQARREWTRRVAEWLKIKKRVVMSDGGPLDFVRVQANSEAHPRREGQIVLTARYGTLAVPPATSGSTGELIQHIIVNEGRLDRVEVP